MYFSDMDLLAWAQRGGLTPFNNEIHTVWIGAPKRVINPASIDLLLGDTVRRLKRYDQAPVLDYNTASPDDVWGKMTVFSELILLPGEVVLLNTAEFVRMPTSAVGTLFLRSGAGRRALEHLHAGHVDGGFSGQLTLEIVNLSGVSWRLRPGDKLVQLAISSMTRDPVNSYESTGKYSGQTGATAFLKEGSMV